MKFIRWFFGLTLCLISIGFFTGDAVTGGFIFLAFGLLFLPPVTKVLFKKKTVDNNQLTNLPNVKTQPTTTTNNIQQSSNTLTSRVSSNTHTSQQQREPINYDPRQIQRQGIQLLESINILNSTKNLDTLIGRYEFISKMYSEFVNASYNDRYVSDIQVSIDQYKTMYYDKILRDFELKLIVKPNNEDLKDYYSGCLFICFDGFYQEQINQIATLKKDDAKQKRKEKIVEVGNQTISEFQKNGSNNERFKLLLASLKEKINNIDNAETTSTVETKPKISKAEKPTVMLNNNPVSADNPLLYLETLNYTDLPKSILENIDKVRTLSQWIELGLKPSKKDFAGRWYGEIKRQERFFTFQEAKHSNHRKAFETGKRITSKPYYIKTLVEQGIPLEDFLDSGEDLKHFVNADNFYEEKKYSEALTEIELALQTRINDDYTKLKKLIQIKLGNEDVVEQEFKKHEFDIDSPIHTGEIYDWFAALIKNKKYQRVVFYILQTIDTLDKLSNGVIKPKIYAQQQGSFYVYDKEKFQTNIHKAFTDLSSIEHNDDAVKMLELYTKVYIGKETKPLESVADIYEKWQLKDKAAELYKQSLSKLGDEDKPRVRARLTKKIDELSIQQ